MAGKMTWDEMKTKYPEEWLLIVNYELDKSGHILTGTVERHAKKKDEVYRLPTINKSIAFRCTGESTFSGLRSHAHKKNFISISTI